MVANEHNDRVGLEVFGVNTLIIDIIGNQGDGMMTLGLLLLLLI